MKRKLIAVLCLLFVFTLVLSACVNGETHEHIYEEHAAKAATCTEAGNALYYTCSGCDKIFDADKKEIESAPVTAALGHDYELQAGTDATCSQTGTAAYYKCSRCQKLFDLTKKEITAVPTESLDPSNHSGENVTLTVTTQPDVTDYVAGDTFDSTGMIVVCKCENCDGYVIDNAELTVTYQTEGASSFTVGDSKVTLSLGSLSTEISVTVAKKQAVISGAEQSYATSCKTAPVIEATSNIGTIVIKYYHGETEVSAEDFEAGESYTVKISVATTDSVEGAEVTATVTVSHKYGWIADAENEDKILHKCACGETDGVYVTDNNVLWIDADNTGADLAFVGGTADYSVKEIKKASADEAVIEGASHEGMVYTFDSDLFEDAAEGYKKLSLKVTFTIGSDEYTAKAEVRLAAKLIRTAADLNAVGYRGENGGSSEQPATEIVGYYVLMNDVDAAGLTLTETTNCFVNAGGFRGVFEGNGYTISNFNPGATYGLFGSIGMGAAVRNVTFENAEISWSWYYFLGFHARTADTVISNVTVNFKETSASFKLFADISCTCINVTVKAPAGAAIIGDNTTSYEGITVVPFDQADIDEVIEKINALPAVADVALTDKGAIEEARAAYDALSAGAKTYVTNYDKLTAAEDKILQLQAAVVTDAIYALPADVALSDKEAVEAARAAYDALSAEAQAYVTNYATLTAAEMKLADLAAAKEVDDLIAALDSENPAALAVVEARGAYDKLTETQKGYVTKLADLVAAEEKVAEQIAQAQIDAVVKAINDLPAVEEVSLSDKEDVQEARAAYDKLKAEQQAKVTNYDKLTSLEARITAIESAEIGAVATKYVDVNNHQTVDLTGITLKIDGEQQTYTAKLYKTVDGEDVEIGTVTGNVVTLDVATELGAADTNELKEYALKAKLTVGNNVFTADVTVKVAKQLLYDKEDLDFVGYRGESSDGAGTYKMLGYYLLMNNVDADGLTLTATNPCWNNVSGFRGVFDGNGKTISNLHVTTPQGLFGSIGQDAAIRDVTFENLYIKQSCLLIGYAVRTAATVISNVNINFAANSGDFKLWNEASCTCTDVTVRVPAGTTGIFGGQDTYAGVTVVPLEQAAIDQVIETINALPAEITLADQSAVEAARTAYDALSSGAQGYVTNYATLTAAETKIADLTAAKTVSDLIEALTAPYDVDAVVAARNAYNALTETQKGYVSAETLAKLTAAEEAVAEQISQAQINAVISAISALPSVEDVALSDKSAVQAARAKYNALTAEQQESVTNLDKLTSLETQIGYIENAVVGTVATKYVDVNNHQTIDLTGITLTYNGVQQTYTAKLYKTVDGEDVEIGTVTDNVVTLDVATALGEADQWSTKEYSLKAKLTVGNNVFETASFTVIEATQLLISASDLNTLGYRGPSSDGAGENAMYGYYLLMNNIDADGLTLTAVNPCWQAASGFRGILEGNNHTISNLSVTGEGLFGAIGYGAQIRNITFDNAKASDKFLTYAARNATFNNVTINFAATSGSFKLWSEQQNTTCTNVTVKVPTGTTAIFGTDATFDGATVEYYDA